VRRLRSTAPQSASARATCPGNDQTMNAEECARLRAPAARCHPGLVDVEARATSAGYRLAQRNLAGQLVWWWQLVDDPEDTRQPCWLERRQALSYMEVFLQRSVVTPA
jgi:hypothetical protein